LLQGELVGRGVGPVQPPTTDLLTPNLKTSKCTSELLGEGTFGLAFLGLTPKMRGLTVQPEAKPTAVPESSWQIEAMAWFETNQRQLLYAGVAALAVWLAAFTYNHFRKNAEAQANAALAALHKPADRNGKQTPPTAAEYLKVAEQHAGTPAGDRALLFAADRLFIEGKPAEARARFEKVLAAKPTGAFAAIAAIGIAACHEAAGEADKALAAYEQVVTLHASTPEVNQARLALGLLNEQKGRNDQALRLYDEVLRAKPVTVWRMEAEMRREQLLRRHPQLAVGGLPSAAAAASTTVTAPATNAPAPAKK